jgi:thymidylate synthase (FAD)
MEKINVLDKGFVELVSHMGSDLTVVNAARVSFAKESTEFGDRDKKLISYLAKNKHWTPFAHPQITLRIKAPIFVRAQLGKHQVGLVMNEVSRRYVSDTPEVYSPKWRTKPTNGAKQGSESFMEYGDTWNSCNISYSNAVDSCLRLYEDLLAKDVAPEQARSVLPQGTYTEWWWTGSLAAFARVYSQRIDPHAQWECREYAEAMDQIIKPLFPHSWAALTSRAV